jgi:hypothetical protein
MVQKYLQTLKGQHEIKLKKYEITDQNTILDAV